MGLLRLMKAYRFFMMIVLINALMAQTFPKTLVLIDYYFQTSIYAAYCINEDKPEMHCNGMCQLDKKMDDLDHHHSDSSRLVEITISNYIPTEVVAIAFEWSVLIKPQQILYQHPAIPDDWVDNPLQPPRFLV